MLAHIEHFPGKLSALWCIKIDMGFNSVGRTSERLARSFFCDKTQREVMPSRIRDAHSRLSGGT